MKIKLFLFALLFIGIIGLIDVKIFTSYLCQPLQCIDFPGKSEWKIKEIYENTKTSWRALLSSPSFLVRIERYATGSMSHSEEYTAIRTMQLAMLYQKTPSPYPGPLSDAIVCQDKYKPSMGRRISEKGIDVTYFTAYANDRLNYGVCVDDQIAYKGYSALFYCEPQQAWYEVDMFVPKDKVTNDRPYTSLFSKIGCHSSGFGG